MQKKLLYTFKLPVRPVAWARPAPCKWGLYDTQTKIKKQYLWEFSRIYKDSYLLKVPLIVSCQFDYAIPKSWSKQKQKEALNGSIPYLACDIDNTLKFTFDLFNGIIWEDDRQIVGITECYQMYARDDSITVKVYSWTPTPLFSEELKIDLFNSHHQETVKTEVAA